MNKKEFFAAVNLYKRQPEIVQWKNDFLPKAIAASAKEILAHSAGNDEDALAFANELVSYTKKLDWLPDSEFAKISSLIEHSAEELVEKYSGALDEGILEHGTKWTDHKYIRIENGRYIYPEDLKQNKKSIDPVKNVAQTVGEKIGTALANKVLGVSNNQTQAAAGAAINKAQADGAKRTANLQKSTYQKIQSAKDVAQQKIDEIEKKQYVKPIKEGQTSVLTGKVATKEDENNAPKTGLANLDLGKRITEKKHDMTLAGDNQGQPTSLYVKNKYFADGVTKTANEFQKQINKADLDKKNLDELHSNMENLAKQNEIRKEKLSKAEAAAEVRKGDASAQKAQAEGEAMQRWKRDQEATKRMDEDKERTINRVADLESGLAKEEFDGELRILKQALADVNVDQKRIDEAKARNAEAVRAKDDNAKNQAQKEGEAMQAWKNAKAAAEVRKGDRSAEKAQSEGEAQQKWKNEQDARKEYDNNIKKYAKDSINSIITQVTKGNTVVNYSDDELDKKLSATNFDTDKINTDFAKALTEEWLSKKDSIDPSTRSGIDGFVSSLINMRNGKSIKPKKLGHSFDLSTKEGYYAAIAEYKRKRFL